MSITLHHFNFPSTLRLAIYLGAYEFFYFIPHSAKVKRLYSVWHKVYFHKCNRGTCCCPSNGLSGSSCLPELALFLPHFRGKQGKSVFGTTISLSVREHIICRTRLDVDTLDLRRPLMWYSYFCYSLCMTFIVSERRVMSACRFCEIFLFIKIL